VSGRQILDGNTASNMGILLLAAGVLFVEESLESDFGRNYGFDGYLAGLTTIILPQEFPAPSKAINAIRT